MTTEQKHVLVIRWQLPNWEKISPARLPMTFQGHGKLFQHNIVGKRPAQNYDNAIYNMAIWFSRSCKKYFVCIPMACSFLNKSYTVYETYLCSDVSSVAARHHFPVRSEYLLAMKHYSGLGLNWSKECRSWLSSAFICPCFFSNTVVKKEI